MEADLEAIVSNPGVLEGHPGVQKLSLDGAVEC
jgi:hypothetical protein